MKQLENALIDNSFEDRMINKLDNRKILSFKNIVTLYKKDATNHYAHYSNYKDTLRKFDRNISVFIDKVVYNLTYSELSKKYNLTNQYIKYVFLKTQRKLFLYKDVFKRRVYNNNI
jgi:hypothetical protein